MNLKRLGSVALASPHRQAEFSRSMFGQASTEREITLGKRWLDRCAADLDEVRAALQWAFGPQGDARLGIELAVNSHVIWGEFGLASEHRRWVREALARTALALKDRRTQPDCLSLRLLGAHFQPGNQSSRRARIIPHQRIDCRMPASRLRD